MPLSGELYWRGQRVKLQELPFRVLVVLLEHEGQIVSRDALARHLWPENTFVEFDQGVSTAVAKLRQALGDVAENPRFVETVPRRGYRFIAPVTQETLAPSELVSLVAPIPPVQLASSAPTTSPEPLPSITAKAAAGQQHGMLRRWGLIAASVLLLAGGAAALLRRRPPVSPLLRLNDRVMLADFENATGNRLFDDALVSALRVKLDESPYFKLVPAKAVLAAREQMGAAGRAGSSAGGEQSLCQVLRARAVIHGSLSPMRDGFRVRLTANVCGSEKPLVEEESFSPSTDVLLSILGGTADRLRRQLGEPENSVQRFGTPVVQATTASFAALQAFAAGEQKRALGQDHETIADYKLATDLDPEFALAYARLGTIYSNENEAELSRTFYQKAFNLRAHATERERLYLTAHYYGSAIGDVPRAIEVYDLWRRLYPDDLIAPNNLADSYETMGQPDQARLMAQEALRIDPTNAFPYAALLQADQRLGLYDEARGVWREACKRKLDNSVTSRMAMFQIGVATGDEALVKQQVEWAASNPRQGEMLTLQGWAAAAAGRLREARIFFHRAQEIARGNSLNEFAADAGLELAQFEGDFGDTAGARADVAHARQLAPDDLNVKAFAAMILAGAGDAKQASTLMQAVRQEAPRNTIFQKMILPMTEARLSLSNSNPDKAVEQLSLVAEYDRSRVTQLASIYYRAQALLAAGRAADANKEFARLLQLQAICPTSPYLSLAHLSLARVRHLQGDNEGSTREYETFFKLWSNADPNIPLLRQARAEARSKRS